MKRYLIIISFLISNILLSHAQLFPEDMFRISQQYPWGTARAMSMGGAFGSLGGDLTSLSINPAGVGVYRSSEFAITPSLNYYNAQTKFGETTNDYLNYGSLSNFGFVSSYMNHQQEHGWMGINFGIAYNLLNDFSRNVTMVRTNAPSSYLDQLTYNANNESTLNPFYEGLALQTGALYTTPKDSVLSYYSKNQHGEFQELTRNISGGIGEWALSMGANYNDQLYLGITFGIQSVDYHESSPLYEQAPNGLPTMNAFTFAQHLHIEGTGVNIKAGAIYRPFNWLRLGAAIHSPTWYSLHSDYYTSMDVIFQNNTYTPWTSSGILSFDNSFNTPWRAILSGALVIPQVGLISVDYEYLNYTNMHLSGDLIYSENQDSAVQSIYKSVSNFRVGAEGKIGVLALRVGYGYYASPYTPGQLNQNTTYQTYSAGFGIRTQHTFIDVAYVLLKYPEHYVIYDYSETTNNGLVSWNYNPTGNTAKTEYNLNQIVMTLGFKF